MIVGFGENSIDEVCRVSALPRTGTDGSKTRIEQRDLRPGGQVATTLAMCASLGLPTRYIGAFGSDDHGRRLRAELAARGIDIGCAVVRDVPNRRALILVDAVTGERLVLWERHPDLSFAASDVTAPWLDGATHVHVDATDIEASVAFAWLARSRDLTVTTDIDTVTPQALELLDAVSDPILAEHVPAALTGHHDVETALRALRSRHAGRLVVTLGVRGAALLDGDTFVHAPGFPVDVVDTTGAGDIFRGAFIHALAQQRVTPDTRLSAESASAMLRFANAAAAISCTREGAMESVPSLPDIERLLRR